MAERCKYEWIFSTEWLNGKFIYSCLCFGILKTAAPQRKSSRGYEKHLTVLIMHNMISESFNESLLLSTKYANCLAGPVPALSWTTCSVENEWPHCVSTNSDSWEMPKAHPEAATSVFESRAAGVDFCNLTNCNAMSVTWCVPLLRVFYSPDSQIHVKMENISYSLLATGSY